VAWNVIDRNAAVIDPNAAPVLSEAVKEKIRSFFRRYPSRRAALLPALHIVQNALGHVGWQALKEIAELLEIPPAQVFDTITFYSHFWTHEKGRKVIVLCRSLSCDVTGSEAVAAAIQRHLGIGEHETTEDGEYSFVTEECLGACEHGPCMLINEKLHARVKPEDIPAILADPNNDKIDVARSDLFDAPAGERQGE
jgi:NADH-quinone oxidoreductase subunit E